MDLEHYVADRKFAKASAGTVLKLRKGMTEGVQRVIRIPLLRPYFVHSKQEVCVKVEATLGKPSTADADIIFFLSDNQNSIGFAVPDGNELSSPICYGVDSEDNPPHGITHERFQLNQTISLEGRVQERYDH